MKQIRLSSFSCPLFLYSILTTCCFQFVLAESELKIYVSNEENEKNKLDNLNQEYESVHSKIEERTKQISILKKKIPATEKSLNDALQELNGVKEEEGQVINEIRRNRMQLEEKRSSMQASRSKGKVLDGLMAQKRDGNCPGLYGRLVSLKKYQTIVGKLHFLLFYHLGVNNCQQPSSTGVLKINYFRVIWVLQNKHMMLLYLLLVDPWTILWSIL